MSRMALARAAFPPLVQPCREQLAALLQGDLTFQWQPTGSVSHGFHAFPAKFPRSWPVASLRA